MQRRTPPPPPPPPPQVARQLSQPQLARQPSQQALIQRGPPKESLVSKVKKFVVANKPKILIGLVILVIIIIVVVVYFVYFRNKTSTPTTGGTGGGTGTGTGSTGGGTGTGGTGTGTGSTGGNTVPAGTVGAWTLYDNTFTTPQGTTDTLNLKYIWSNPNDPSPYFNVKYNPVTQAFTLTKSNATTTDIKFVYVNADVGCNGVPCFAELKVNPATGKLDLFQSIVPQYGGCSLVEGFKKYFSAIDANGNRINAMLTL